MKKLNKFGIMMCLSLSTLFLSCSSDDEGSGGGFSGPATGSFLKAKQGSTNFMAQNELVNGDYVNGNLVVQGFNASGKQFIVQLYANDGSLETGTYDMHIQDNQDYVGTLSYVEVNTNTFTPTSYNSSFCDDSNGTVEITFIDATKIEGTFSFKGKEVIEEDCSGRTKNVTNGSFRLVL